MTEPLTEMHNADACANNEPVSVYLYNKGINKKNNGHFGNKNKLIL